mmetsp:Transcript_6062/g.8825  ORF Transcript_6062/g.8825 Transcript_6062/m.8825 type:complete len:398 (-) Transcript_6062:26-1219(-)
MDTSNGAAVSPPKNASASIAGLMWNVSGKISSWKFVVFLGTLIDIGCTCSPDNWNSLIISWFDVSFAIFGAPASPDMVEFTTNFFFAPVSISSDSDNSKYLNDDPPFLANTRIPVSSSYTGKKFPDSLSNSSFCSGASNFSGSYNRILASAIFPNPHAIILLCLFAHTTLTGFDPGNPSVVATTSPDRVSYILNFLSFDATTICDPSMLNAKSVINSPTSNVTCASCFSKSHNLMVLSKDDDANTLFADGWNRIFDIFFSCPNNFCVGSLMVSVTPPSGICHMQMFPSPDADANSCALNGENAKSVTGAVCPSNIGTFPNLPGFSKLITATGPPGPLYGIAKYFEFTTILFPFGSPAFALKSKYFTASSLNTSQNIFLYVVLLIDRFDIYFFFFYNY